MSKTDDVLIELYENEEVEEQEACEPEDDYYHWNYIQ
jgi:hypothetical protein